MIPLFALLGALAPPASPGSLASSGGALDIEVAAHLDATALTPGETYELTVDLTFPDGVLATGAGTPSPILQLGVPACVQLTGKDLWTAQDLARNNHLRAPFERLIESGSSKVEFVLASEPGPDDRIAVNVVGYLADAARTRESFVRKRVEVALLPGASGEAVEGVSDWGPDEYLLQIGDRLPDVELWDSPDPEQLVSLSSVTAERWSVVATYRAHW